MSRAILRFPSVAKLTGLCRTSVNDLERGGKFPRRVRISARAVGWYSDEIDNWISARDREKGDIPQAAIDARQIKRHRIGA